MPDINQNDTTKLISLTNLGTYHDLMDAKKEEKSIILTQAEYDALTPAEKMNGKTYFISDAGSSGMIITASDVDMTGYSKPAATSPITTSDTASSAIGKLEKGLEDKVDSVSGKGLSTNDYTDADQSKLSGIASGAEVNQNAFSNVKVGSTTIVANAKTDTLEFVAGTNITLTPDSTNDKITISSNGSGSYSDLSDKPSINNVTLSGNKTGANLGLVDAVSGKGLSTNDYTNADKDIVDGVTSALAGKADSATTLAGYGITDAYTKSSVDTALALKADKSELPDVATASDVGLVKPDGTSITVDANGVLTAVGGGSGNTKLKTRYSISYSSWSSSPNSDGYYTYSLTLSPTLDTTVSPDVLIAGSSNTSQPTDTHRTMFEYVERCYLSGSSLTLYAKTKPTDTFYIWVKGVAGSGSGSIVGNVIQPNGASGGGITPVVSKYRSYKSDFTYDSTYKYWISNKYLSGTDYRRIENSYLSIATIVLYRPAVEWFSYMGLGSIMIAPNVIKGNTSKQVRFDAVIDKGASLFENVKDINVQFNPVHGSGDDRAIIIQTIILDDLYNQLTSDDYIEARLVII